MKPKRIFNFTIRKMDNDEFIKNISKNEILNKETVLNYLKQSPEYAFTSEPVKDYYTGEIVYDANNARSDGEYIWYESEIYHFEKYNLKLNDDFIEHVLKHS